MAASVADTSMASYSVGWRKWTAFASLVGIPCVPPQVDPGIMLGEVKVSSMIALTFAFCQYHFKELKLSPATICGYLSGVSFNLKLRMFDVDFITSPAISMVRAGMKRVFRQSGTSSKGRLPFVLDMILTYKAFVSASPFDLRKFGLFVAMMLAFSCLLRRSEYIPTKAGHFLRAKDVSFVLADGSVIPSHLFSSSLSHLVTEIIIFIRSSKCDQEADGFPFSFLRRGASNGLCEALITWASSVHLCAEDAFLSTRNAVGKQVWCVNASDLTKAMRITARGCLFSKEQTLRFSPHSLRYGGASTLSAAGVDRYQIQLVGRWSSDAYLTYVKATHSLFARTQAVLSEPAFLPICDVLRLV